MAADAPAPWAGAPGAWDLAPAPEQYTDGRARDVAAQQLDEPLSDDLPEINLNILLPPDSVLVSSCLALCRARELDGLPISAPAVEPASVP